MRALPALLAASSFALAAPASAFPGVVASPGGALPAPSAATVMLAHQAGVTTLTVAARLDTAPDGPMGLILPVGGVAAELEPSLVPPEYLERVEAWTAPRVADVGCDEVVVDRYYSTPPGCTSYEPEITVPDVGEPALEGLALNANWLDADWALSVVTVDAAADGLQAWLDTHGLALPGGAQAEIDAHVARGGVFVVGLATPTGPASAGAWLEPVQVAFPDPTMLLASRLGASAATGTQDLVLIGLTDAAEGAVEVTNYPRGVVEDDCLLDDGELASWHETALDAELPTEPLPRWLVEYSGPANRCEPCLGDPLEAYELLDFGWVGEPEEAWVTRLHLRYLPTTLDEDLELSVAPIEGMQIRYIAHAKDIEFAFPECGGDYAKNPGVCEGLHLPGDGCVTGRAPSGWLAVVLVVATIRRRRAARGLALLGLLAVGGAVDARAAEPADLELVGRWSAWSTDRVRINGLEQGGPHLWMPQLGVDARIPAPLKPLRERFGLAAGLRGFVGNATPGFEDLPGTFTFFEPHAGLDVRWGAPGEREVVVLGRVGLEAALGIFDSTLWKPRATLAGLLRGGFGVAVGDGDRPALFEVQATVVPRTDGFETSFHPNVGLPGWLYYPGAVSVDVGAGVAFR